MSDVEKKSVRLQKALAQMGLGSRREIEGWIKAKRISVDGEIAQLGVCVDKNSHVEVDNKAIVLDFADNPTQIILYHKPVGEVCTRKDEKNRKTIFENLPKLEGQKWTSIGRLDLNTSGLLLLTTDGELANKLMHPSANLEREYAVRVIGHIEKAMLARLKQGVMLDDGQAKFHTIRRQFR